MTSIVWVPIEPVEPTTLTVFNDAYLLPFPKQLGGLDQVHVPSCFVASP
jgi:hypothetical protein